ncbi:MAG: PhzF family phenazine biosynthesis protein [Cyanobacteria bacterium J06638_28]
MTAVVNILQVDAFTDQPFGGNPAAVCVLAEAADAHWMQAVAAEMNLSETAYLYPIDDGYQLRWFTPAAEVDLCGHATLASAHVLWSEGHLAADQEARFHTRSGLLTATQSARWITLNFPGQPVAAVPAPPELLQALPGAKPIYVGHGDSAEANFLVELESEAQVRSLQPDFAKLKTLSAMGLIVTASAADPTYDFVSRYFAPAVGIDEDPVTGSAHCTLALHWQTKLDKSVFLARQVSAREGILKVECRGDRVLISGQAVTVLRGSLLAPFVPAS